MKKLPTLLTMLAVWMTALAAGWGCRPRSPEPVNAAYSDMWKGQGAAPGGADTTLLARLRGHRRYAARRRDEWERNWHTVSFGVLRAEKGRWAQEGVSFTYEAWRPAPGSGVRMKRAAFPFRRKAVYALHLKTGGSRARIVAHEQRSYLPPHGKLRPCGLARSRRPADKQVLGRVTAAVREFARREGVCPDWHVGVPEETAAHYVADYGLDVLLVEKKSYAVKVLYSDRPGAGKGFG